MDSKFELKVFVLFCGFIIGIIVGAYVESRFWEAQAIRYGYAQYDSQTGNWEWKVQAEEGQKVE